MKLYCAEKTVRADKLLSGARRRGALIMLFLACTAPPPLLMEEVPAVAVSLFPRSASRPMTAFGDIRLCIDGDVHRGSIEVCMSGDGAFSADFYAAFGIPVGSIRAEKGRGTLCIDDMTYTFSEGEAMDTLPVAWGRSLTMADLIRIFMGEMPSASADLLRRKPDSCADKRNTISALWKTDSIDMELALKKRSRKANRVVIVFKRYTPFTRLTFSAFSGGRAHKIEVRENDRNYFTIGYSTLKYE